MKIFLPELLKLDVNKRTGLDGIPARFLKGAADAVKSPLTYMINLPLERGFPTAMKYCHEISRS